VSDPTVLDGRAFFFAYRSIDGKPVAQSAEYDKRKNIGARHAGRTNALAVDTHVEAQRPERIRYDQVSWTRWAGPGLPPGGL
jgi:prepilin-type processing-associated H-X9-DG protein